MEEETSTLLCGDLFTQGGSDLPPVTESAAYGPEKLLEVSWKCARAMVVTNPTELESQQQSKTNVKL